MGSIVSVGCIGLACLVLPGPGLALAHSLDLAWPVLVLAWPGLAAAGPALACLALPEYLLRSLGPWPCSEH